MSAPGAPPAEPLVVSYGAGVDSTAMLVGLHARGIRPDAILFADTGGEKDATYAYLPVMQAWLASVGFPAITVARRAPTVDGKNGSYDTLETNCLVNATLPSLAFGGRKACSLKWKVEPMDAWVTSWAPARAAWAVGLKVRRAIGYDAGPVDSKRCWDLVEEARFRYVYFLREWGWDRERCVAEIAAAGLPVPVKSACFFCPATKPAELIQLHRQAPEKTARIRAMEVAAAPGLKKIAGLWGAGVKGSRGAQPRPGSMSEFLRALDAGELLDDGTPREVGALPWDGRAVHFARVKRHADAATAKAARHAARTPPAADEPVPATA
ncbi:MAG: hypothetical protein EKK55_07005 [Rhodocyclaceae bacterium]|nr:MAG: hypothetical protein EKK55_07005 [Rhodocyclaceae bacterium]